MTSLQLRRGMAVATTATLALMLLAPSAALAQQPGWKFLDQRKLPDAVNPGNQAGYGFTLKNGGSSNISQLFLTSSIATPAAFVQTSRDTETSSPCVTSPQLLCTFGALNSQDSITVVVSYVTPTTGTKFDVTFYQSANGYTLSDGDKKTSHGDALPQAFSTPLRTDKNFVGGFNPDGWSGLANDQSLGPKNIQAGKVSAPQLLVGIGASLEDGLADTTFSCTGFSGCSNRFGEWTRLDVNKGTAIPGGIKLEILILGNKVPSGATTSTINLIHVPDVGDPYLISTRCTGDGLNAGGVECIKVTTQGNNFLAVVWLNNNGGNRLSY